MAVEPAATGPIGPAAAVAGPASIKNYWTTLLMPAEQVINQDRLDASNCCYLNNNPHRALLIPTTAVPALTGTPTKVLSLR